MQWMIDTIIAAHDAQLGHVVDLVPLDPTLQHIIIGNGSKWVQAHFLTILNLFPRYVSAGNKAAADLTLADFTLDNAWHNLSLAALVPPGTQLVHSILAIRNTGIGKHAHFKHPDYAADNNASQTTIQAANNWLIHDIAVPLDSSRQIKYKFSVGGWTHIYVSVKGWWF